MAKNWYVVHTYSGFENRAKQNLEERIKNLGKGDFFSTILVPTETVVELVKGKRKTSQRKIFPGYILVKMELNEETWHIGEIWARCESVIVVWVMLVFAWPL